MDRDIRKAALSSIIWIGLIGYGVTSCVQKYNAEQAEKEAKAQERANTRVFKFPELIGSWQSACGQDYFGHPAMISIEISPNLIRWANHSFDDKDCTRSATTERFIYSYEFVEDIRILGDVGARVFRLGSHPYNKDDSDSEIVEHLEVFKVEDGYLYISAPDSGPEYDKPWDIASNFGLRKLK